MSAGGAVALLPIAAPPRVSVIICAYTEERWDDLVEAVASVGAQTAPPCQTVVVVDHNPALLARVGEFLTGVTAVANDDSQGLSGARNSGVRACTGDVVAFLDDDAVAAPDWLERLAASYADPQVMGAGGSIEPDWRAGARSFLPAEFNWVVGCTYRGMPESTAPVRNLIGANMSFRRDVLQAIGGFRAEIGRVGTRPVGCEETELCIRALQTHPEAVLLYEPSAAIRHKVPASRTRWSYFVARCYSEGISKARVAGFVGARDATSTEREYALKTLPRGVARGITDTLGGRDRTGVLRSAAIIVGLAATTTGYLGERIALRRAPATSGGGVA